MAVVLTLIHSLTHSITHSLSHPTVQSPSWAANWFAASQEIPPHFTEPEGSLPHSQASPTVSILGQPNPVHIPTSHFLQIRPNIIHPTTPRSPQWSLSLRIPILHIPYHVTGKSPCWEPDSLSITQEVSRQKVHHSVNNSHNTYICPVKEKTLPTISQQFTWHVL